MSNTHFVPLESNCGEHVVLVAADDIATVHASYVDERGCHPVSLKREHPAEPLALRYLHLLHPAPPDHVSRFDLAPQGSPPRSAARPEDLIDSRDYSPEQFAELAAIEHLKMTARRLREQSIEHGDEISEQEAWLRANENHARALGISEEEIAAARAEYEAWATDI
jgi:hypothetical protein